MFKINYGGQNIKISEILRIAITQIIEKHLQNKLYNNIMQLCRLSLPKHGFLCLEIWKRPQNCVAGLGSSHYLKELLNFAILHND